MLPACPAAAAVDEDLVLPRGASIRDKQQTTPECFPLQGDLPQWGASIGDPGKDGVL